MRSVSDPFRDLPPPWAPLHELSAEQRAALLAAGVPSRQLRSVQELHAQLVDAGRALETAQRTLVPAIEQATTAVQAIHAALALAFRPGYEAAGQPYGADDAGLHRWLEEQLVEVAADA
jgi:hypothetical protein